jgi:putative ABC transport system substrate-binding protein
MILAIDAFLAQQGRQIAELATRNRLPWIGGFRDLAEAGGLMSYGQNLADNYRRAASYVDKILKGAKPGDLPVEQSTKFELVINRKTARALGLAIPAEMMVLADQVIQ